jgi:hypothetical protein
MSFVLNPKASPPSEQLNFAKQAEILIPSPISASSIRRVWVDSLESQKYLAAQNLAVGIHVAEEFFANGTALPPPAVPNFANIQRLPATRIVHKTYGEGTLVCNLAGKCVVKFDEAGLRLIRFGEYDWLD